METVDIAFQSGALILTPLFRKGVKMPRLAASMLQWCLHNKDRRLQLRR